MKKLYSIVCVCVCLLAGIIASYAHAGDINSYSKKAGDIFYPKTTESLTGTSDRRIYFRGWASTPSGTVTTVTFDLEDTKGVLLARYTPTLDKAPSDAEAIKKTAGGGINAVRFDGIFDTLSNEILTHGTTYIFKIHVFYKDASGATSVYALPALPDASGNKNQSSIKLTYKNKKNPPAVLDMGDGYSVTWVTEEKGIGWISYTYQGERHVVYDEKNGIKRTDDTIHFVKVPKEHLDNNKYVVGFQAVTTHAPGNVVLGSKTNLGTYSLRGYSGQEDIEILALSDVHEYGDYVKKALLTQNLTPDIILLNGDIAHNLMNKDKIHFIFRLAGDISGGTCPVFYIRGNHEVRGAYSTELLQYLPTETGEFYYASSYGPARITCMAMGDDAPDTTDWYGGLAEYSAYRKKQLRWLKKLTYDESYTYHISFCHTPFLSADVDINYARTMSSLGVSLSLAGHTHTNELRVPTISIPFYVFTDGAHQDGKGFIGSVVTLKNGKDAYFRSFNMDGAQVLSEYADLSTVERTILSDAEETETDNHAHDIDTVVLINSEEDNRALSATMTITAEPVIFETGGDDYTICWETSLPGTGHVYYMYEGTEYAVSDAVGGCVRTLDTIHSVKVPKSHLRGNAYRVHSKHVAKYVPGTVTYGDSVTSATYYCVNPAISQTVEMVVVPDLKADLAHEEYADLAGTAVKGLRAHPRIIVLGGDATNNLQTKADLGAMLRAAAKCGGSYCPTVFVRGNLDCRGSFAYHLAEYLKPVTGSFYYQFTYGNVSAIVLDCGEDKEDSHAENFGLVDFTSYRAKQTEWLKSVTYPTKPKACLVIKHFSHRPDFFADDWESILKAKGTNFALYGDLMQAKLTLDGAYGYPELVCGGMSQDRTTCTATRISFSDRYAFVYAKDNTGTALISKIIDLDTASVPARVNAQEPPMKDGVYLLSKEAHLLWVSEQVALGETFDGKVLRMTRNIDMRFLPFTPIGGGIDTASADDTASNVQNFFSGTFDGQGYLIQNLNVHKNASFVGLFGLTQNAIIRNVELYGGRISTNGQYVGFLAGAAIKTKVSNCGANGLMQTAGGGKVGGLIGFVSKTSPVTACASSAAIGSEKGGYVGGLVGQVYSGTVNITDCYFAGEAWAKSGGTVGGVVGYINKMTSALSGVYNRGRLFGATVGQLVGDYDTNGSLTLTNAYYIQNLLPYTAFSDGDTMTSAAGSFTAIASVDMKKETFPQNLSERYQYDSRSYNAGYPVLPWQVPTKPTNIMVSGKTFYTAGETASDKAAVADGAYETVLTVRNEKKETVNTKEALPVGKYTAKPVAYDKYGKGYAGTTTTFYVSQNGFVYPDAVGSTVTVITSADCPTDKVIVAIYDADGRMTGVKTYTKDENKTYTAEDAASLKVFLWQGIMPQAVAEEKSL